MKAVLPRISIITSSFNQGKFIARTIESVLAQNYSPIEHIVVDGMSTDETNEILKQYPHLKIIQGPDRGQADAINKGFKVATGDILCFLNSDDTFAPGTLHRVAEEIAPSEGRHIIMGRCRFIDEDDQSDNIEHPSYFIDHMTVLKIWQGHGIPQPAVFWSREALERCGLLDENENSVLDYDLFCRFSRHYRFHTVNQLFANYRLHAHSKTNLMDEKDRLAKSVLVSRRYWKNQGVLFYLRIWFSWRQYQRREASRHFLKKAKSIGLRNIFSSLIYGCLGAVLGPDVIYYAYLNPHIKTQLRLFKRPGYFEHRYPRAHAYINHHTQWPDRWIGPHFKKSFEIDHPVCQLFIQGKVYFQTAISIQILLNGKIIASYQIKSQNNFSLKVNLPETLPAGMHEITILTPEWFIMHHYIRNQDYRPIAWKLFELTFN